MFYKTKLKRPLLKEMKKNGERNIVLDCSQLNRVSEILQQAQQVGMTTLAQSYFITSLVKSSIEKKNQLSRNLKSTRLNSEKKGHAHFGLRSIQTRRSQYLGSSDGRSSSKGNG